MTVAQAESIIAQTGIKIALYQRFAFDTGTLLRLENYALINVFDDGRYYIQGEDTAALKTAFNQIETPWDPDAWAGEVPRQASLAFIPGGLPTPPSKQG